MLCYCNSLVASLLTSRLSFWDLRYSSTGPSGRMMSILCLQGLNDPTRLDFWCFVTPEHRTMLRGNSRADIDHEDGVRDRTESGRRERSGWLKTSEGSSEKAMSKSADMERETPAPSYGSWSRCKCFVSCHDLYQYCNLIKSSTLAFHNSHTIIGPVSRDG